MSSITISFFLLFSTPAALSLLNLNTSLALVESNKAHRSAQTLGPQENSIQPRLLPGWANPNWYLGLSDTQLTIALITLGVSALAAIIIFRLLSNILDTCISIWAYSPPANQVVIEAGNMRLEFGCSMEPVPWDFIADWTRSRRDAVNRGFAPSYAKEWWFHQNLKRLCYVGIRMVPDGAKAERPYTSKGDKIERKSHI